MEVKPAMRNILTWAFNAVVFTALGGFLVWMTLSRGSATKEEHETDENQEHRKAAEALPRVSRTGEGDVIITFDHEAQIRMGIEAKPLEVVTRQPEIIAYGTLQEDPSRSFALRAPMSGIVHAAENRPWPRLGDKVENGLAVGMIVPRLNPVERADLAARLAAARADAEEAQASLSAARASFESKKSLNTQNKIVSDVTLAEAEAKTKGEEARLKAAIETIRVMESSLVAATGPTGPAPLAVTTGGQVVEVLVQPGEAVEGGQAILRVVRFDRLIARISLPPGERVGESASTAQIVVIGYEDRALSGERIAAAPAVDPRTGGPSFLFAVSPNPPILQPGTAVTAYLPLPGQSKKGVLLPRSAVVRIANKTWVYVKTAEDKFTRREVTLDQTTPNGWFVTQGFSFDDRVVLQGAQSLLSEEFSFQGGEEEE
jgi:multidrug efflux pump subunit AcrA (membrane-fusion protein)